MSSKHKALREHMTSLGYPLHQLTDEEIDQDLVRLHEAARRAGLSMKSAAEAFRALGGAGLSAAQILERFRESARALEAAEAAEAAQSPLKLSDGG